MSTTIAPLEVRGIRQRFGRKRVLRRVDLRVDGGELVGLVGANGSGKTTLFSIITGLLPADSGSSFFAGQSIESMDLGQRARLAYVAHRPQVYLGLSARENLDLFADLRATVGAKTAEAGVILERFGLAEVADRLVSTFSRGMAQRLSLARALASSPDILILDEPFTALDRQGRELLAEILGAERARGSAIFIASHDHDMLVQVADRILHLENGVIAGEAQRDPADQDGSVFRRATAALWSGASSPKSTPEVRAQA